MVDNSVKFGLDNSLIRYYNSTNTDAFVFGLLDGKFFVIAVPKEELVTENTCFLSLVEKFPSAPIRLVNESLSFMKITMIFHLRKTDPAEKILAAISSEL